jgi:fatty acid-binding protein DegV
VIELTTAAAGGKPVKKMALIHVNALEQAKDFYQLLSTDMDCPTEVIYTELTPGLSVHAGAGIVGVVVVTA